MNCKCGQPCIIRVSKKPASYDQEFYACPNGQNGCQGWIGWVDESKNQKKPAFQSSFKKGGGGAKFSKSNEEEICYNSDGEPCCKQCGISCITKMSRTEKNMNREFFVCQKNCQVWNGWTDSPNAVKTFFKKGSNAGSANVVPPKPQSAQSPQQPQVPSKNQQSQAPLKSQQPQQPKQPKQPQALAKNQPTKNPTVLAPVKSLNKKPMLDEERFSDDDIDLNDEY